MADIFKQSFLGEKGSLKASLDQVIKNFCR
jgi:hypothetical protein